MATQLEPKSQAISVNGLRLHYLERGDSAAPALVCVHGYTGSAQAFISAGIARMVPFEKR